MPAAFRFVENELAATFRGNKNISFEPGDGSDVPDVPASLTEPDDMLMIASPCHTYEPVKVPGDSSGPFRCLLCGTAFAPSEPAPENGTSDTHRWAGRPLTQ